MSRCSKCGSIDIVKRNSPFEFVHNGTRICIEDNQSYCETCGNISYIGSQISAHERAVADAIRKVDSLLSADELRIIRLKYGLRQVDMEKILGLGPKTWTRWERGKVTPTKATDRFIRALAEYPDIAQKLFADAGVESDESRLVFEKFEEETKQNFKKKIFQKYSKSMDLEIIDDLANEYRESENTIRTKLSKDLAVA